MVVMNALIERYHMCCFYTHVMFFGWSALITLGVANHDMAEV